MNGSKNFELDLPNSENFTISLFQAGKQAHGRIILKQVGAQNCLVKIGVFFINTMTVNDVGSEVVDWIVL
jgi:hypothetical protein